MEAAASPLRLSDCCRSAGRKPVSLCPAIWLAAASRASFPCRIGSRAPPTGGSEQCLQINPRISFTKNHELLLLSNYVQYIAVLSPTLNTTWPTFKNSTIIIWGFIKSCRCLMLFTTKVGYLLLIMNCTMQWYKWPKSTSQYKVVHFNIPYGFMFKTQCN